MSRNPRRVNGCARVGCVHVCSAVAPLVTVVDVLHIEEVLCRGVSDHEGRLRGRPPRAE